MSFKLKHAYTTSSRVQAVQAATAVCYGLGALCWITNATWSGWPSENSSLDSYLTGTTAVVGALLFHLGAFCQLLDSLNSKQHTAAFTRLPSGVKEPWLDPLHPSTLKQPSSSTATNSRTPDLLAISPSDANNKSCEVEWWGNCLGAGSKQLHRSGSADSLAGLSADSEVQLSELEGRSPRSNSTKSPLPLLGELDGPGGQLQTESAESQQSKQLLQQRPLHERGSSPQPGSAEPDTLDGVWHRCGAEQQQQLQQQQQQSCSGSPVVSTRQSTLASFQPCSPVGSSPVSPASDSKGVRRTGGRSLWQQASHLDAWVWWQWRPQDRPFVAAFVQVVGTTIFLAACVCGFPGVLPTNYDAGDFIIWDALFWAPFLLGSCLFITSALLSLRDCQGSWGTAQPSLRSWWMHVLNLVGSIGFWLCSFFGFFAHPAERFQRWGMAFSCLWGSCCFAVAAFLQLLLTWVPEAAQFG